MIIKLGWIYLKSFTLKLYMKSKVKISRSKLICGVKLMIEIWIPTHQPYFVWRKQKSTMNLTYHALIEEQSKNYSIWFGWVFCLDQE